jgi:hypothetical protein
MPSDAASGRHVNTSDVRKCPRAGFCKHSRSVRDEVDVNTYRLFDLERGVPTDFYDLDEAVTDGFLSHHEALIKAPS